MCNASIGLPIPLLRTRHSTMGYPMVLEVQLLSVGSSPWSIEAIAHGSSSRTRATLLPSNDQINCHLCASGLVETAAADAYSFAIGRWMRAVGLSILHLNRLNSVISKTTCFDLAGLLCIITRRMQIEDSRTAIVNQDGVTVAVFGILTDEKIIFHSGLPVLTPCDTHQFKFVPFFLADHFCDHRTNNRQGEQKRKRHQHGVAERPLDAEHPTNDRNRDRNEPDQHTPQGNRSSSHAWRSDHSLYRPVTHGSVSGHVSEIPEAS